MNLKLHYKILTTSLKINRNQLNHNMEEIFSEAKSTMEEMLSLLIEGYELLPKRIVPRELLKQDYTYYKGVIVPIKTVSHRYLFDDFEAPFLDAYIALFKKLLEEHTSISSEFAFRTLLEMGSEDSLFILISLLADYGSIETSERKIFNDWLIKLFQENEAFLQSQLSKSDFDTLLQLKNLLQKSIIPLDKFTVLLKATRQLVNKVKAEILNKYTQKKIFGLRDNYKRMKSGEAHMLHGNVFLIHNRMSQQPLKNHIFQVFAHLAITGTDMLNRLSGFLSNKKFTEKVNCFMEEHTDFKKRFSAEWEKARQDA